MQTCSCYNCACAIEIVRVDIAPKYSEMAHVLNHDVMQFILTLLLQNVGIVRQLGHCIGGNFNIHIWA